MAYILVTELVLKLSPKVIVCKLVQPSNILLISVTEEVLKPDKLTEVRFSASIKIPLIFVTLEVLSEERSKDVNFTSLNISPISVTFAVLKEEPKVILVKCQE